MKKLIVLAAVAMSAAIASAASANWMFWSDDASTVGLDVYLVSSVSEFADVSAIQANLVGTVGNSGKIAADDYGGGTAMGTIGGLSNDAAGSNVNFYYVIVSADGKGYWTQASSAEIYTTATAPVGSEVDGTALLQTSYTAFSGGSGSGGGAPEPTSGLLLLVGTGLLGLRRKRA